MGVFYIQSVLQVFNILVLLRIYHKNNIELW